MDINSEYILDLKAILNFINFSDNHNTKESEIIDHYEKDENKSLSVAEKTIREITSSGNAQMDNIGYDLIKLLLTQILSYGYNREEDSLENTPFGFDIAFNTLINEKLLKKR
jgi:hypothetical protein